MNILKKINYYFMNTKNRYYYKMGSKYSQVQKEFDFISKKTNTLYTTGHSYYRFPRDISLADIHSWEKILKYGDPIKLDLYNDTIININDMHVKGISKLHGATNVSITLYSRHDPLITSSLTMTPDVQAELTNLFKKYNDKRSETFVEYLNLDQGG